MPNVQSNTKKTVKRQYAAPALSKGLDILELMSNETSALSLKEIGDKLNRSPGHIFRMLVILNQRGYVSLIPNTETYVLTLKIFELSHRHPRVKKLASAAMPEMDSFTRRVEQSCQLVTYYDHCGIIVAQQDSPADRGFSVRLGSKTNLWENCSGHLLLAYANAEEQEEMISGLSSGVRKFITNPKLTSMTERVKSQGYERIKSQQFQAVKDIGYPVFDAKGEMIAALVCPFLEHIDGSHAVDISGALEQLKVTAESISTSLVKS